MGQTLLRFRTRRSELDRGYAGSDAVPGLAPALLLGVGCLIPALVRIQRRPPRPGRNPDATSIVRATQPIRSSAFTARAKDHPIAPPLTRRHHCVQTRDPEGPETGSKPTRHRWSSEFGPSGTRRASRTPPILHGVVEVHRMAGFAGRRAPSSGWVCLPKSTDDRIGTALTTETNLN
jgi:hypothetical protein